MHPDDNQQLGQPPHFRHQEKNSLVVGYAYLQWGTVERLEEGDEGCRRVWEVELANGRGGSY